MNSTRAVKTVFKSRPTLEGAGVHLKRAFAFNEVPLFDPFLLLDDFRSDDPRHYLKGFPWHPHRGIETITYIYDGKVEHGDSMGNSGTIGPGDVQWMTAGSGIIHQEMPKGDASGRMGGFQLWANLPAAHKMMEPRYRDVKSRQIPKVTLTDGVEVRIICGTVNGTEGPVRDIVTRPEYLDVTVPAGTEYLHPVSPGRTVFAYVVDGKGWFCRRKDRAFDRGESPDDRDTGKGPSAGNETLLLFGDGEHIAVATKDKPVRLLLVSGKPIGEPVAWQGPIVMNTQQELRTAFEEYENGTFIKNNHS